MELKKCLKDVCRHTENLMQILIEKEYANVTKEID
jgi:hypothetical protein